ncbi:MAG TPA: hypothetical protein VFX58_20235 [Chitinophagaceae bacterium]|nr:hypothetical protein [Chitinophagaceae bacterium]
MKISICLAAFFISFDSSGQNVGIGNVSPSEKLDVNGNINVTGTIKANGTDGQPNQVLMKNGNGVLAWGDLCEFKNMAIFRTGSGTWNIPAGITRFVAEVWGGGGGGNWFAGGGGGGYIRALFTVDPGATSAGYSIGLGGNSGSGGLAGSGNPSTVTYDGITVTGAGGAGANYSSGTTTIGAGGDYSVTAGFTSYAGVTGSPGQSLEHEAAQSSSTAFFEFCKGGRGGDAGNATGTGGIGAYSIIASNGALSRLTQKTNGLQPGGGGGSGYQTLLIVSPSVTNGALGGNGLVIFRY